MAAVTDLTESVTWPEHHTTSIASATWGGYHVLSTPPLRQFLTPGLTDVWLVFHWAVSLVMVAVDWPKFVYTVLRQLTWSFLLVDVKLVQRRNQGSSIRYDPLDLRSSLQEGDHAWAGEQMAGNASNPLYLGVLIPSSSDSDDPNSKSRRQDIVNLSRAHQGIEALLRMARLHSQDAFGTCTALFLIILGVLVISSIAAGTVHLAWFVCSDYPCGLRRGDRGAVTTEALAGLEGEEPCSRRGTQVVYKRRAQDVLDEHLAALGQLDQRLDSFSPSAHRDEHLPFQQLPRPHADHGDCELHRFFAAGTRGRALAPSLYPGLHGARRGRAFVSWPSL